MFDLYQLPEEHRALRDAVRTLCEKKVAPNAAAADETSEFPQASHDALRAADFHAPHMPEEYGGPGADALATAIVIEEVARACAATSLVPAVNKLGTLPLLLAGSAALKQRYLLRWPAVPRCSRTACPSPRRAATPRR
jgi:alkylation response protein AidB-like acyl-CoA dehydrogenase